MRHKQNETRVESHEIRLSFKELREFLALKTGLHLNESARVELIENEPQHRDYGADHEFEPDTVKVTWSTLEKSVDESRDIPILPFSSTDQ